MACQSAGHRQFDFWVGRWSVFTPDGKLAGDNEIEVIEGGCALLEHWRGNGGFTGTSLNHWDPASGQWHQHWVDNQGGTLRLAGTRVGASMVLVGTQAPSTHAGCHSASTHYLDAIARRCGAPVVANLRRRRHPLEHGL